ncbi:predicted protein [Nematostella vectensis]|uniref:Uncharacterized protein n=1 Tax=Nematostella vectensis TaxID=45351 RepID=A7RVY7_NEMVE|nr:predicted protein [Nematostella vectensis]|eukprot:XP_001636383.1 predicted protein [Nematostella vectensis]
MTTGNATRGSDDAVTAPRTRARAGTALGVRTKRSVRMRSRAKTATRRPALSDRVEIGHQTYGRLVALPETHVGLVQLDSLAANTDTHFVAVVSSSPTLIQQADVNLKGDDLEGQFHYVNFKNKEWDTKMGPWKRSKEFYDYQAYNLGDHRASTSSESEVRFLSEALQKSLQLQARVPPAPIAREPSPANSKPQGRTLINNHVRSIVRECLKEAELQWPESDLREETPERAWEEPERTETPGVQSEVTANLDWESFTASRDAEEDHIEQSEDVEEEYGATHASPYLESTWEWSVQPHSPPTDPNNDQTSPSPELGYCPDNTQGLLEPGFYENTQDHGSRSDIHLPPSLYEPALLISSHMDLNGNEFGVHKSGSYPYVSRPASRGDGVELEEMVTMTENARLDAWRSSEAMKIASSSGVPSRVGSATSRARQQPPPPPPQRPASPSHSGPVPVKTADRWLARGKNVNAMCLRRVEKPLPGWMEGLQAHRRRPQSSPSVRRPMSSVSTRSGMSSHDPGNPGVRRARGAAAVYVSGRSPPTYTRIQSARVR